MNTALPLNLISATEAADAIAAGRLTSEALVSACLDHIRAREPQVQAWAYIDPELALAQARARDREPPRSRLHGIPVGVKDVIDTCDMPTEYGSPIYRGHRPNCDAACVAQVRERGGVILGKAVSTEFATRHPNKTRHPLDPSCSPGGSSSGSAAAVADGMVPIAFGTQTSSSIVRPAAYCGVIGYKPSFGLINRAGMKFLSESLDTIGTLTRTIADAALIVEELAGLPRTRFERVTNLKPRIGLCRTAYWNEADSATQSNLEAAASTLGKAGARVAEIDLRGEFAQLAQAQIDISSYEFYRALTHERTRFPELISASLTSRIAGGSAVTREHYENALVLATRCRAGIDGVLREHDVLIAPAARGEACAIDSTGDPVFGLMWTLLQLPCLTLPFGRGARALPLAVQVIGGRGGDPEMFVHAEWMRRALA